MVWLWVTVGILAMTVIILALKIYLMKKSAREIEKGFADRLVTDTNTLIDISSNDKCMRSLANSVNTELKKLKAQRHRFTQGDFELKNAVTNISHDLRTPLTAVSGYLSLLDREEKSEAAARYIAVIKNRTEAMIQLTEELFSYSYHLTSSKNTETKEVDICGLLEESIASFYTLLTKRNITPMIRIPDKKIIRRLNRQSISRVFSNLLSNAIKYSDGDLAITLTEDCEIIFENSASSLGTIQIGRLFERFYTVESAQKSTGLGLTIAKTLVEQEGGQICAEYDNNRLRITVRF